MVMGGPKQVKQPVSGAGIFRFSPYADTCLQAGSDQALAALSS